MQKIIIISQIVLSSGKLKKEGVEEVNKALSDGFELERVEQMAGAGAADGGIGWAALVVLQEPTGRTGR